MMIAQAEWQADSRGSALCPLCGSEAGRPYHHDGRREYLQCGCCQLVFVPEQYFLSTADEKTHYDLHENHSADTRYRQFLSRLADPLLQVLPSGARGLDFGCGPGPTLSQMLAEAGFPTEIYDPYYAPQTDVWNQRFDFITASEVVEHLHRPLFELERLWSVLNPGGYLGIMTKRVSNPAAFARWHYIRDPTHVAFFSDATFQWLSQHWSASLEIHSADVVLMRKKG